MIKAIRKGSIVQNKSDLEYVWGWAEYGQLL